MSTLICFALKEEAAPFQKVTAAQAALILITGIGRQNAEKSVREFLAGGASVPPSRSQDQARLARTLASPDLVLTCGFAGGLNPDLKIGDVVFEVQSPKSGVQSPECRIAAAQAEVAFELPPGCGSVVAIMNYE